MEQADRVRLEAAGDLLSDAWVYNLEASGQYFEGGSGDSSGVADDYVVPDHCGSWCFGVR